MVDRTTELLKRILHEEEMKVLRKEVAEQYKRNQRENRERENLLSGPTEHIDLWRKAGVNVTATDIVNEVYPYESKIETEYQNSMNRLAAHKMGIDHGFVIRIVLLSLFWLVYIS